MEHLPNIFCQSISNISTAANEAGLQLADLIANPIGRHVLGMKKTEPGNEVEYKILEKKMKKTGLTILPK